MAKIKTHVTMPEALLQSVDQVVGPRKRSRFIAEAVAEKLRYEQFVRGLDAGAGAWKEEDHSDLSTQKGVRSYLTRHRSVVNRRLKKRRR